jgi:hypothetical protein
VYVQLAINERIRDLRVFGDHIRKELVRNRDDIKVGVRVLLSALGEGVVGHVDEEV